MAAATRNCVHCARLVLETHCVSNGQWEVEGCAACQAARAPRPNPTPGKWPPINLGVLSLFCDPVMVTSIFAIGRALEWLRYAAGQEAEGNYSPWHAEIRSNAIWTIVLALLRPIALLALIGTIPFMRIAAGPAIPDASSRPQLTEVEVVRACLRDERVEVRRVGMCQLIEFPHDEADEERIRGALPTDDPATQACAAVLQAGGRGSNLADAYRQLSVVARNGLLPTMEIVTALLRMSVHGETAEARTSAATALTLMCDAHPQEFRALHFGDLAAELRSALPTECEAP